MAASMAYAEAKAHPDGKDLRGEFPQPPPDAEMIARFGRIGTFGSENLLAGFDTFHMRHTGFFADLVASLARARAETRLVGDDEFAQLETSLNELLTLRRTLGVIARTELTSPPQ
jgi:hypothetical protein